MAYEQTLIDALEERNPQAVELAEAVSCAIRIEPFLLRQMRLELLRHVDAGAEADVWLSPMVEGRSAAGVVFAPAIAETLRQRLYSRPDRFERAWKVLRASHAHLPFLLQLEEEIAYLSAKPDAASLDRIQELLGQVAATLISKEERPGLANWAARALPLMPAHVRNLESAAAVAGAAYFRLGGHLPLEEIDRSQPIPEWLPWTLPGGIETVRVRVRLVPKGVELAIEDAGDHSIPVPKTKPCLVELLWREKDKEQVRQIGLWPGEKRTIRIDVDEVRIRTLTGESYRLAKGRQSDAVPQPRVRSQVAKPTCFVIMAFGRKTDYPTGRVLDLDKTYRAIIKPAAIAAGLECMRADEIIHSGVIDIPMYEQLLLADVVVADLSTYNCTAFYELGVRHGLKPYTTIVIAEDKMVYPFDVNHIPIRKYQHMGEGIDFEEVERMRSELAKAIEWRRAKPENDSPVYEFLKDLLPPRMGTDWGQEVGQREVEAPSSYPEESPPVVAEVSALMSQADDAFKKGDFNTAKALLNVVRGRIPSDTYVIQKLALATYKSRVPDALTALQEARQILETLKPDVSTDPETLGLWGAVHKGIWNQTNDRAALDEAVFAYEKSFYLKNDYYNGINLAYLLNMRSAVSEKPEEAITDFVLAQRTRRRVIEICNGLMDGKASADERYWILATLAEAAFGLGDQAGSQQYLAQAAALNPPPAQWMKDSTAEQLARLENLLKKSPLDQIK